VVLVVFDLTGVCIITGLQRNTKYKYRMGYFFSDAEVNDAGFQSDSADWGEAQEGEFTTASDSDNASRSLIIGSCRYLLKTFLGSFWDNRGDKTFRSVNEQIDHDKKPRPVHQLIMMGDQIYADDLNAFNPDKSVDQFYKRYQDAFGQEHLRKLMSRVPTYMTLDDHEIEDNWPSKASEKDWKTVYPNAIHAYQAYQLSHSPNIPVKDGRLQGTPKSLWYNYTDGCCDVFVTDSRTERWLDNPDGPTIIGEDQMKALNKWLADGSDRVKLIVTSVPFAPEMRGDNSDKWGGFPSQRTELLEHIEKNQIKRVVFLSGDVHASMAIKLTSPSGLIIGSVISSAFFWPYPHPSADRFQLSGKIDGGDAGLFTVRKVA
ncbi:MAG: alkaline phosphatase D family protein, partial [Verrucomicrobiota bacterium]